MGGFLGGLLTGAVVVAGAGVMASLMYPLAPKPDVTTEVRASEPLSVAEEGTVSQPGRDADLVELAPHAPGGPDDTGEATDAGADTVPGIKPDVSQSTLSLAGPETGETPFVATGTDSDVALAAPLDAPEAPPSEEIPQADPTIAELPEPGSAETTPAPAEEVVIASSGSEVGTAPEVVTGVAQAPEPTPPTDAAAPTGLVPSAEPDETQTGEATDADTGGIVVAVEAPAAAEQAGDTRLAGLPQIRDGDAASTTPRIGTRVVPLTERRVAPAVDGGTDDAAAALPPLQTYAAPFDNAEGKPLMSIVLIDDEGALGVEALQDFPYPLTFAVDPTEPDAAEKMASHRAAGFEVVLLTDMPVAATAQDAEVSLSVWLDELPETVAIFEGSDSGIQGNRALSDQVAAIAGGTGRGLITQNNGLNTAAKLAVRNGVPAAVVFRDFDGAGQTPTVMRRFLDQAAFRAGQEGAVVMLGRVRPDTISALLLWGLQDRASRVALAPISATLNLSQN